MPVSGDGVLEATFDPAWAAVRLIVDGGMWPSAVDTITITRVVAGEAVIPVRGVQSRGVVGGYYVGTDHEAPLESTVTYTVDGYLAAAFVATATVAEDTSGAADGLWLKVAGAPDLTTRADLRPLGEIVSPTVGGVYQIAGGGGAVAQTSAQWSGIESELTQVTLGVDHPVGVARLRAVLASRVLLLQPSGGSDLDPGWYFVRDVARANPSGMFSADRRDFTLNIQRTGIPAGAGSGIAGTTWAALMDTYPTWADVLAAKASWFDVLKGF